MLTFLEIVPLKALEPNHLGRKQKWVTQITKPSNQKRGSMEINNIVGERKDVRSVHIGQLRELIEGFWDRSREVIVSKITRKEGVTQKFFTKHNALGIFLT